MKHIKIFETFTELPRDYTRSEIENMTMDQFIEALKKYDMSHDAEQGETLLSIWINKNYDNYLKNHPEKIQPFFDVLGSLSITEYMLDKGKQMKLLTKYEEEFRKQYPNGIPGSVPYDRDYIKKQEKLVMSLERDLSNAKSRYEHHKKRLEDMRADFGKNIPSTSRIPN